MKQQDKTMNKKQSMIMFSAVVALAVAGCGKGGQKQAEVIEADTTQVVYANRDSAVYGICGDGSAMNTLQLITDIGDQMDIDITAAKESGKCFGGYESGDRMMVMLSGKNVAKQVVNLSAMLGDWVMPNPMDGSSEMGIRIKEGGIAESIDHPSVNYRSWRMINGKLEIVAVREGGGDVEEIGLYEILALGPDTLAYKDSEDIYEYNRQKEHHYNTDIQLEEASEDDYKI